MQEIPSGTTPGILPSNSIAPGLQSACNQPEHQWIRGNKNYICPYMCGTQGNTTRKHVQQITVVALWLLLWMAGTEAVNGQPQPRWSGTGIEVNVRMGKVLKHTNKFLAPIPELTTAYEVNLMQQTYGK